MEFFLAILSPLIFCLRAAIELFHALFGNYGAAIVMLALFVSLLTWPLTLYGQKIEQREKAIQDAMAPRIRLAKENFKGEAQFNEIEKIYKEHDYHPIKSLKSVASLAVQLPFLISCLLLLIDYPPLQGQGFLFLKDLAKPDALLFGINILPFFMAAITLTETAVKPEMAQAGRIKFSLVTLGILLLIYTLPSAVVLYWTASNIISLIRTMIRKQRSLSPQIQN